MKEIEAEIKGKGLKIGMVAAKFNQKIGLGLVRGAVKSLKENGVAKDDIELVWVPGAMEIPLVAKKLVDSKKYDALVVLGAVIKGETAHFDYIAEYSIKGVSELSLAMNFPVGMGILTTYDYEQAERRAGGLNKGGEAARAALEMVEILKQI